MHAARPTFAAADTAPVQLPEIPTARLNVGGLRLHCADLPARGPTRGAPLVWIHGLGGWLRNWAANVGPLTAAGYRCVALDLPGFGESDKPNVPYDTRFFRTIVLDALDALGIERATLLGNSMGGMISLALAIRNPERVDRLVLVDAAGVHRLRRTAIGVTLDLAATMVRHGGRPARIMRAMRHWVFERQTPELLAELRLEFAKYGHEGGRERRRRARSYTRALWNIIRTDLRPWLPTVGAATLVVHGKQDKLVPLEAAGILHRELPHARLATFDRCGHVPQMEWPEKFNDRVVDFLATAPAAG